MYPRGLLRGLYASVTPEVFTLLHAGRSFSHCYGKQVIHTVALDAHLIAMCDRASTIVLAAHRKEPFTDQILE